MRPFYQGKLDIFCAVYAVINALRRLHGISAWQAKRILAELLIHLPQEDPARWESFVNNATDYVWLVERMLGTYGRDVFPVRVERPWGVGAAPSAETVWTTVTDWLAGASPGRERTGVFRFQRFMPMRRDPVICHWSTLDRVMGETLFLFDASMEETAVHIIDRSGFATRKEDVACTGLILVEPPTFFLLQKA